MMFQKVKPYLPATIFAVATFLAVATAVAALTGSVPSLGSRVLNGNGTTGSIACEFTGTNKPATKWWVGSATPPAAAYQYNVMSFPATAVTGFPKGVNQTIYFSTAAPNIKPAAKVVSVTADKTTVLYIKYQ